MTLLEHVAVPWIDGRALDQHLGRDDRPVVEPTARRGTLRVRAAIRALLRLAGLIVVATAVGVFAVTPDGTGLVQGFDSTLSRLLHIAELHPTDLTNQLGTPNVVLLASLAVVAALWRRDRTWPTNFRPVVLTAVAGVVAWSVATVVRRPGPGHLGDLAASGVTSFPSVSAAMLAALACAAIAAVGNERRLRSVVAMVLTASLPSLVRLVTQSTWPLDELVGAMIGWSVVRLLRARHEPSVVDSATRRARRPYAIAGLAAALVLFGIAVASFVRIIDAPGNAPVDQRTVEWLRSNNLGPLVDRGESWWLWRHLPSPTETISRLPPPPIDLGPVGTFFAAISTRRAPRPITPMIMPVLPLEGRWTVAQVDLHGQPEVATTDFRPDPVHPSVVVAVAWINSATTRISLIAGTREPGNGVGPAGGRVPDSALSTLLAAFNSGYKMEDTPGGTLMEGRATGAMVSGVATLAVRPDGTATVGEWGRDLTAAEGYVGLRQNLHLMVSGGVVAQGLKNNSSGLWGTVRSTLPTWRSGLGVTADGNLVYVAGDHLTLSVLADALVRAGAVTAMELDIHKGMVAFNVFGHRTLPVGHTLLPNMPSSADRYLSPDWRDFVVVTSRSST